MVADVTPMKFRELWMHFRFNELIQMGIYTPEQIILELNSLNDRINLDIRFESFTVWTDYEIVYLRDVKIM